MTTVSIRHMSSELRIQMRSLECMPQILPDGCAIAFMADEITSQRAVCRDTVGRGTSFRGGFGVSPINPYKK
jgi:hypothetical protein